MKQIILFIMFASIMNSGGIYFSDGSLQSSSKNFFLSGVLGEYHPVDDDGYTVFDEIVSIRENEDGSVKYKYLFKDISGVWQEEYSFPVYFTNFGNTYFFELKTTENNQIKYVPFHYSISNNYLKITPLSSDFFINMNFWEKYGIVNMFSGEKYRYFVEQNLNNSNMYLSENQRKFSKFSGTKIENDDSDKAAALLILLGAIILGNDNDNSGSSGDCKCAACSGRGTIHNPAYDQINQSCGGCGGTGRCN